MKTSFIVSVLLFTSSGFGSVCQRLDGTWAAEKTEVYKKQSLHFSSDPDCTQIQVVWEKVFADAYMKPQVETEKYPMNGKWTLVDSWVGQLDDMKYEKYIKTSYAESGFIGEIKTIQVASKQIVYQSKSTYRVIDGKLFHEDRWTFPDTGPEEYRSSENYIAGADVDQAPPCTNGISTGHSPTSTCVHYP